MDNLSLSKDEVIVKEQLFTPNLLFFWIKTKFILTNKRLVVYKPSFIFGLIPKGYDRLDQPIKTISAISSSKKYSIFSAFIGLFVFFLGLSTLSFSFLVGIILLLLSFECFTNVVVSSLLIKNNGGLTENFSFSYFERNNLQEFSNELQNTII